MNYLGTYIFEAKRDVHAINFEKSTTIVHSILCLGNHFRFLHNITVSVIIK